MVNLCCMNFISVKKELLGFKFKESSLGHVRSKTFLLELTSDVY